MARASNTSIFDFMQLPIRSLFKWIESANEVEREDERERKRRK